MLFFKLSCRGFHGDPVLRNPQRARGAGRWALGGVQKKKRKKKKEIHTSTAGGRCSIPGWGTKILHIMWPKINKQNCHVKIYSFSWSLSNSLGIKKNLDIPINQIFMVKTKTTKRIEMTKYE